MIFQIIGIEYNTFHFKTVWSNFGDDWRVLMRQLKLYYWKGWLVSIDSLCSLSCCSPIHEPVAIPLRTGTEYTSRWSLFSVWNGTLTKDVTPATPCRTYKSFLTKLTLKWHRKYLVQINLCQKLSFLQNMGRTCCVQKLFWMSEAISVHNMFSPGLSLEFSSIELVIQWTICCHIVG